MDRAELRLRCLGHAVAAGDAVVRQDRVSFTAVLKAAQDFEGWVTSGGAVPGRSVEALTGDKVATARALHGALVATGAVTPSIAEIVDALETPSVLLALADFVVARG